MQSTPIGKPNYFHEQFFNLTNSKMNLVGVGYMKYYLGSKIN